MYVYDVQVIDSGSSNFENNVKVIQKCFRMLNRVMSENLIKKWLDYAKPLQLNVHGLCPHEFLFILSNSRKQRLSMISGVAHYDRSIKRVKKTGTHELDKCC